MRALLALLLAATLAGASTPRTGTAADLLALDDLPRLRDDVTTQSSSFDRSGGNDDGFSGANSAVGELPGGEQIIFDADGPGIVDRIWSANPNDPANNGFKVYVDRKPEPVFAIGDWPKLYLAGAPGLFGPPLAVHYLGGWCSYVPIPFTAHCTITTAQRCRFYHVTWTKLAAAGTLQSFSGPDSGADAAAVVRAVWADPAKWDNPLGLPLPPAKTVDVPVGQSGVLYRADGGAGVLRALRLRVSCDDPRWGRRLVLTVTADGAAKPQVWSPVADFFADPFRDQRSAPPRSTLLGLTDDGWYYCNYPMPYATGITVSLQNEALDPATVEIVAVQVRREALPADYGRLYAWWHRENPIARGKPFTILEATGRGHWCGVSHAMRGIGGLGFLEGDEQLSADGQAIQTFHGTGTEDYFNGGWYFGGTGRQPLWGVTVHDDAGSRCHAFRLHVTDCVPFQRQASLRIEHGAVNDYPSSDYAGVTYWYAEPSSTHTFQPVPVAERLGTSPRRVGVVEAEEHLTAGGTVIEAPVWRFDTGGDGMVEVSPGAAPVTFTIPAGREGLGTLQACAAQPGAASLAAELDGKPIGQAELATGSQATQEVAVGAARWARGEHKLVLMATGGPVWIDWLRVVPAPRAQVRGAVVSEGEELPIVAVSDGAKAEPEDLRLPWSALSQLGFRPTADGQELIVELTVPSPRPYELLGALSRGPEQGIVEARLGDKALGDPVDAYAAAAAAPGEPVRLGLVPAGMAGKQRLTLRVVGKSDKSGGRALGLDYLALRPASSAGWFEGEKLPIVRKSPEAAELDPQDLRGFGPIWSEGAHLWFRPGDHADASFTLKLTVPARGRYNLGAYFTKAVDYGKVAVELDGKRLGEVFDGFNDGVVRSDFVALGAAELAAGEHELTFRVAGKSERSVGYMVGVDAVYLW